MNSNSSPEPQANSQQTTPVLIPEKDLDELEATMLKGRNLDAWDLAKSLPPCNQWEGPKAQRIASGLIDRLGNGRQSTFFDIRNWRRFPEDEGAISGYESYLYRTKGPLAFLKYDERNPTPESWSNKFKAYRQVYLAYAYSSFRDFESAQICNEKALSIDPENRWVNLCRALLLDKEDRREEAIEALKELATRYPDYVAIPRSLANHYWKLEDEELALETLSSVSDRFQDANLTWQAFLIYSDRDDHEKILSLADEYERLSPLLSDKGKKSCNAWRMDAYRGLRKFDEVLKLEDAIEKKSFHANVVKALKKGVGDKKRVRLEIPHVAQVHMTCAPASLAMLSAYWGKEIDQTEIVEEICYDGTYDASERKWCVDHGWVLHEFRLDWDTLRKLIDLKVPCALSTKEIQLGHLQVVSGYDELIEAVIIQDPSRTHYVEHLQKNFFEKERLYGPRAMVILPPEKRDLLSTIDLPDEAMYTALFELNMALEENDREAAQLAMDKAMETDPENSLTYHAKNILAYYDGATLDQIEAMDALDKQFPDDERIAWKKLGMLRSTGQYRAAMELMKQFSEKKESSICWTSEYGTELTDDARRWKTARKLLEKALAISPVDSSSLRNCASLERIDGSLEEVLRLARLSAFASYRNEYYNRQYANDLASAQRVEEAIEHLRKRVEKLKDKSPQPRITYCQFLGDYSMHVASQEALDELIEHFPEDGDALIYASRELASNGDTARSQKILAQAQSKSSRAVWLRAAAKLAHNDQRTEEALGYWQELSEREPLARDAIESVASLLGRLQSNQAAVDWLKQKHDTYPDSYDIHVEYIRWLQETDLEGAITLLESMAKDYPQDAWVARESSRLLLRAHRKEASLEEAERSCLLAPQMAASWYFKADALRDLDRLEDAREAYMKASECDPDNSNGVFQAIAVSVKRERKEEVLKAFKTIAENESKNGEACSMYVQAAAPFIDRAELLNVLRKWKKEFSNCWNIDAKIIALLSELSRTDEALQLAEATCQKYSLYPAAFADYAELLEQQENYEAAIENWKIAFGLNRSWTRTAHGLVSALDFVGKSEEALEVLEAALRASPNQYTYYGFRANILLKRGDMEGAIAEFKRSVLIEPGYDWAWGRLSFLLNNAGRHAEMIETARDVTRERPGEARSWLILGDELKETYEAFEALECYDKALELNPDSETAIDQKCLILANTQRIDEAIALCEDPHWQAKPTAMLKGRLAWLQHKKGEPKTAIETMRKVVNDYPTYEWGWDRIIDWLIDEGELDQALESAEEYIRRMPNSPDPYYNAAWVCHNQKKRQQCADYSYQALKLNPSHTSASYNYLRAAIFLKNPDMILEIVPTIRSGQGNAIADCFELNAAVLQKNKKNTEAVLKRFEDHPNISTGWLDMVYLAVDNSKADEAWFHTRQQKALSDHTMSPQLANLRMNTLVKAIDASAGAFLDEMNFAKVSLILFVSMIAIATGFGAIAVGIAVAIYSARTRYRGRIVPLLKELEDQPDCLEEAIHELLDVSGDYSFLRRACRKTVSHYATTIANAPRLVGKAGYACASNRDWGSMIRLYQASEASPEWECWMAFNYINAHIYAGELAWAQKIAKWALETLVPDHTTDGIRIQLMWLLALRGNIESANDFRAQCSEPLPKFSGVRAAENAAKSMLSFKSGDSSAADSYNDYLGGLDQSDLGKRSVEIALHYETLNCFSQAKITLFQKMACLYGIHVANLIFKVRRSKMTHREG